jgi:hypothetical protein
MISIVAAPVYVPTNSVWEFISPNILARIRFLDDSNLSRVRWSLSVDFIYISSMANDVGIFSGFQFFTL